MVPAFLFYDPFLGEDPMACLTASFRRFETALDLDYWRDRDTCVGFDPAGRKPTISRDVSDVSGGGPLPARVEGGHQ